MPFDTFLIPSEKKQRKIKGFQAWSDPRGRRFESCYPDFETSADALVFLYPEFAA